MYACSRSLVSACLNLLKGMKPYGTLEVADVQQDFMVNIMEESWMYCIAHAKSCAQPGNALEKPGTPAKSPLHLLTPVQRKALREEVRYMMKTAPTRKKKESASTVRNAKAADALMPAKVLHLHYNFVSTSMI